MKRASLVRFCLLTFACNDRPPPGASTPPSASGATTVAPTGPAAPWQSLMVVRPAGWSVTEDPAEKDHAGVIATAEAGKCTVRVDLWAGLPPSPGGPMVTQSKRSITVDGHKLDLVKTSQFQGAAAVVDAVFANDGTSYARAVFRDCTQEQVDQALGSAKLAKNVRDQ